MYAAVRRSRMDLSKFNPDSSKLEDEVIPRVKQLPGIVAGYWLAPIDGMGMSILLFETKADAEKSIPNAQPGDSPAPGVTVETFDVIEVVGMFR